MTRPVASTRVEGKAIQRFNESVSKGSEGVMVKVILNPEVAKVSQMHAEKAVLCVPLRMPQRPLR